MFPLSELNSDILSFHLIPLLEPKDIISLFLTSKTLQSKLDNDVVWHQLYTKSFHSFPLLTSVPINPIIKTKKSSTTSHQQQNSNWHDFYKLRKRAKFYAWGAQENTKSLGDLQLNGKSYDHKPLESRIPVEKELGESIAKVDSGGFSYQILTTTGKLYRTGLPVLGLVDTEIKMVSSGRTEYLAVNEKNELLVGDGMNRGDISKLRWFDFSDFFTAQSSDPKLQSGNPFSKPESLNIYSVKAGWHKASCRTFGLPSRIIIWHTPSVFYGSDGLTCNAAMIHDIEDDPILDYLLLSRCVIYITKNGSLYRVDIDQDDYNTWSAPTPDNLHKLTNFHNYANAHRVDRFSSENPKFVRISGHFHNFAVVTDDGQLLLGQIESDVPKIIDELQPASLNAVNDGRRHGIVSVAVDQMKLFGMVGVMEVDIW
ncbi:unnamed protein product [Ambrosiozyma monospora]|uniref:Unnamed protein product n=1 Tax=Ambrosiozyma monospora TaxID=43982 RepID=A0ACB5TW73_AMBMO|nr:unnamed protein product [Ambrosiozyma monospora]